MGAGLGGGLVLGHGLYALLGWLLEQQAGLYLEHALLPAEAVLALLVLLCGALCSWLPAWYCGRRDIAAGL